MPAIDQLVGCCVNHANAISGFVSGSTIFIHAGRHSWRAAQCHKESFPVRRRMNPARSLACLERCNNGIRRTINHGDVAGSFITDKHEVARRFSARGEHERSSHDGVNPEKAKFHALPIISHSFSRQRLSH